MKTTSAAPERIGLYGIEGSGKTKGWAEIAAEYRRTGTPGTFHVITAEASALKRLSDGYEDFWANTVPHYVSNWQTLREGTKPVMAEVSGDDWIIVENSDKAWLWVRELYDEHRARRLNIDLSDTFAMLPEDLDRSRWDRINDEYFRWFDPLWSDDNPAHLLMTAPQTEIVVAGPKSKWEDDKDLMALYRHHGFRPHTQKLWSARMHTVLWMQRPRVGEWTFTSIKDRERELLQDERVISFPLSYLMRVGGWSA